MWSFFALALFCLAGCSNSEKCPAKYQRFSSHHTFCLAPNPKCQITRTGVSQQDKQLILKLHNEFRSKIAMGNEKRSKGGSMPQAADMMQMEWDDELAALAQKWSESCVPGHDCGECKAVENFRVGQNLAWKYSSDSQPDWIWAITKLFDEVKDYHTSWLGSYRSRGLPKVGHFTQLVWSKSWRVGCGYSYYKDPVRNQLEQHFACNYGPRGNNDGEPVYKKGSPCSACPTNSQCSTSNRGVNTFPGLCKMNNPNTAPVYRMNQQGILFYCGGSSTDSDCQFEKSGDGSVQAVESVGGNYYSIVIKGGQSTTLTFNKQFKPNGNPFCVTLTFRKSALVALNKDESKLALNYKIESLRASENVFSYPSGYYHYHVNSVTLPWNKKTKLVLTFSVPKGAREHVLDLKRIMAYDGYCVERKD